MGWVVHVYVQRMGVLDTSNNIANWSNRADDIDLFTMHCEIYFQLSTETGESRNISYSDD